MQLAERLEKQHGEKELLESVRAVEDHTGMDKSVLESIMPELREADSVSMEACEGGTLINITRGEFTTTYRQTVNLAA